MRQIWKVAFAAAVAFWGLSAQAATVTFNFNSLTDSGTSTDIRSYMNTVLAGNGGGTVTAVSGAEADNNYAGDNHVVGSTSNCTSCPGITLGTSDNVSYSSGNTTPIAPGVLHTSTLDTFVMNTSADSFFTITFDFNISAVSFDWEIFPDAGCANGNTCGSGNFPDFKLFTNAAGTGSPVFMKVGVMPGSATLPNDESICSSGGTCSGGGSTSGNELAPQGIGVSGTIAFAPTNVLRFEDWPSRIAIDNLVITRTPPPSAPEFSGNADLGWIFGVGGSLLGLVGIRRRTSR
jgi:hypothetical protein